VNEIAQRLFAGYKIDGGKIHLSGCQLTDLPFLRLTFLDPGDPQEVRHVVVAHDGSSVDEHLIQELNLADLEPLSANRPRLEEGTLRSLTAAARRVAARSADNGDPQAMTIEPLATTVVWIKQANGQLQFTIGESAGTLPFSGWAQTISPKPFVGSHSGASTFHLAATDDGRIDAAEQIVRCELTGERVLCQELVTCCVTGKRVKQEFTQPCPVSGRPAISDQFARCPVCRQEVSKAALTAEGCTACRSLRRIKRDDPRLVWIVGEHPRLARWRNWQFGETLEVYLAQGTSLFKRILVVVDKETLKVRHLAVASRLEKQWTTVPPGQRGEWLG
jgi:hypothetical protein